MYESVGERTMVANTKLAKKVREKKERNKFLKEAIEEMKNKLDEVIEKSDKVKEKLDIDEG